MRADVLARFARALALALISERELWACALQVLGRHGDAVDQFMADRVADLSAKGDREGVATWLAIAHRADQLRAKDEPKRRQ